MKKEKKKKNRVKICLVGRMEMWEDKKCFIFPHLCLVGEVEEWRDENLLGLIEKKNKRIKKKLYKFTIVSLLDETEGKDIIFLLKFVYVKKEKKKVRRRKTQNG